MNYVWGIDADTKTIVIYRIGGNNGHYIIPSKGQRAEDRISQLYQGLEEYIYGMEHCCDLPRFAFIEKPMFTGNPAATISQAFVIGMIRGVLWRNVIDNSLVDPGVWKKAMLGTGHASKEEIKALAIARFQLSDDLAQDVYDAAMIAAWGAGKLDVS